MPIKKFRIINAGPFADITFEFDERVNIFVGPNNSGKSAALLALAEATVYPFTFPQKFIKTPGSQWELAITGGRTFKGVLTADIIDQPEGTGPLPDLGFSTFVPALRQSTDHRSKCPSINAAVQEPDANSPEARGFNAPELRKRRSLMPTDATLVSDQSVIQKMVDLDYAAYRHKQPQIHRLLKKVGEIASEITDGYPIKFQRIGEDDRGLFPEFQTIDGDLPLNVLSQGTQSTIQWLSHFLFVYAQYYDYPEDLEDKPGILIVDEIDAHLHPSWQRRIIPALLNNFPNLQLFCSTHSPLMLSGLKEGQLQLLKRDANGKITASSNWQDMVGWSAEEILRSVLEVRDTMDLTTASEIDRMGELSIKEKLTESEQSELAALRQRVGEVLPGGPASYHAEFFLKYIKKIYSEQEARSESAQKPRPRVRKREGRSE